MLDGIDQWLKNTGFGAANRLVMAALVLAAGVCVIRILLALARRALEATKLEKAAHTLVLSLAKVALYLLLGLSVASSLGIDVTGVVALASVLTLAVSLALQNMLTNVLGGFTLLSTHPFHSGDFVEIAGQSGTVEEINMTYTRLATPDNKIISIPNSAVTAAQIINYSATGTRRVEGNVQAPYDVPPEKVVEALIQSAEMDNVLLEPAPMAALTNFGDSAMEYVLRFWTKSEDYWDLYYAANQRVYQVFQEQGIQMPYPRMTVELERKE